MKKVLITGAGGYIGSNAAEYFVSRGFHVTGMIRKNGEERFSRLGVPSIRADLCDFESLDRLFEGLTYDYVIHIAARASDGDAKSFSESPILRRSSILRSFR
ncbi:MAG: NAD(P)-dependent oxidoreductase [Planctomycetaceae bacterium]|nr:NAD(P)-dependent oxidoreductase [Planctomycetaceae bacterium]